MVRLLLMPEVPMGGPTVVRRTFRSTPLPMVFIAFDSSVASSNHFCISMSSERVGRAMAVG